MRQMLTAVVLLAFTGCADAPPPVPIKIAELQGADGVWIFYGQQMMRCWHTAAGAPVCMAATRINNPFNGYSPSIPQLGQLAPERQTCARLPDAPVQLSPQQH